MDSHVVSSDIAGFHDLCRNFTRRQFSCRRTFEAEDQSFTANMVDQSRRLQAVKSLQKDRRLFSRMAQVVSRFEFVQRREDRCAGKRVGAPCVRGFAVFHGVEDVSS